MISIAFAFAAMAAATRLPVPAVSGIFVLFACLWVVVVFGYILAVPHLAVVGVLGVTIFQNVALGLFGGGEANRASVLLVVVFTTALPAALACWYAATNVSVLRRRGLRPLHVSATVYTAVVLLATVTSGQPPNAILPSLRNAFAFLIMFYFGLLMPNLTHQRLSRILKGFASLVIIVLVFGYLERFVLGDAFWIDVLHLDVIARHKNLVLTTVVPEPLPADFYSPIEGEYYRRMASLFATPISMGYFVAFSLLYLLPFAHPLRRSSWTGLINVSVPLLVVTLLLTLVKGAYGIAGLGGLAIGLVWFGRRLGWSFGRIFLVWASMAIPAAALGVLLFPDSTALLHLYGLTLTFQSLSGVDFVLGHGMGAGGTISERLGASVVVSQSTGAESGIGTLLYQTGILGIGLYLSFSVLLLKGLYGIYQDRAESRTLRLGSLGVIGALSGLLGAVFLQENALAPIPIAPYYIFAGLLLNAHTRAATTA